MSVRVVNGAQWGDEGKGKNVDYSVQTNFVRSFQGGANGWTTLKFDDKVVLVLHLVLWYFLNVIANVLSR